ncbi:MAG: hypothetical protein PHT12_05080 [Patescibacteria group bacterium]|nr:hypothetical protein [Patescibacteria group bacterium]
MRVYNRSYGPIYVTVRRHPTDRSATAVFITRQAPAEGDGRLAPPILIEDGKSAEVHYKPTPTQQYAQRGLVCRPSYLGSPNSVAVLAVQ